MPSPALPPEFTGALGLSGCVLLLVLGVLALLIPVWIFAIARNTKQTAKQLERIADAVERETNRESPGRVVSRARGE